MTSKERVKTALAHKEPDRVPVGEWQLPSADLMEKILDHPTYLGGGLKMVRALWDGRIDEVNESLNHDLVEFVRKVEWDILPVGQRIDPATLIDVPEPVDENTWRDQRGGILRYSESTDRIMMIQPPTRPEVSTCTDVGEPTDVEMAGLRLAVRELGQTHFLFAGPIIGHPRLWYSAIWEVEDMWCAYYENPEAYRDKELAGIEDGFRAGAQRVRREGLDAIARGPDFGHNNGPFVSPAMFRRGLLPILKQWCAIAHEEGLPFILHSCGNNRVLVPMFVEAGVDCYQSLQPEMNIPELKKEFGSQLTLMGGVPAELLVSGTPEQVRVAALEALDTLAPGGGYIFGTSHSIMPGATYENYMTMLDTLHDWNARHG